MTQSQEKLKLVSLDMICTDSGIESREEEKNPNIIQRFAQVMRDGGNYPSIMCFPDREYYRLIYGLNLLEAAREAGLDTILVDVHPNPSGYKLKNREKDRMVKNFLSLINLMGEEEKENWSWRQIAKRCGSVFDESTVRNKAKELGYTPPKKIKRASRDGNLHLLNTSKLGQHNKRNRFDWRAIDDKQFEKLVSEIVKAHHPVEIKPSSGTGGKGRDLQAKFISKGSLGEHIEEIYFVEAKHHQTSVKPEHISGALTWAQAEQPSALVIAVSSDFTNPCRNTQIPEWRKNNPKVRVILWNREDIEYFIKVQPSTRALALELKIISKSMINNLISKLNKQFLEDYQNSFIDFLEKMGKDFGISVDTKEVHSQLLEYGFSALAQHHIGKSCEDPEVGSIMVTAFRKILDDIEQQKNI